MLGVFAWPVAGAFAIEVSVSGATATIAPGDGESGLSARIDWVPGPCAWPVEGGGTLNDPAGCLLVNLPNRTPGAGCVVTDSLSDRPPVAGRDPAANLTACGLSGVTRVEVQGGGSDDHVVFERGYAYGGETVVTLSGGTDDVEAADGAVQRIDCGSGFDRSREDAGDVSTGCEDSDGTSDQVAGARDGRIGRAGDALLVDYSTAAGNELHRVVGDVHHADGGAIGVSTIARGPVALGDGCTLRQASGDALCAGDGLGAIEVRAPRAVKDLFVLDVALGGDRPFAGPVTIHGGPGGSVLDVADGVSERVDCGLSWDAVTADAHDVVAGSCEHSKGEGTLLPQHPGVVRARAGVHSGRQKSWHGNSGQAVELKIACPAVVRDGCGGIAEVTLTRAPRVAFGAMGYDVSPGQTRTIGVVGGVDAGAFHADKERITRARYFSELRVHGAIRARVVTARGFGAHRRSRTFAVVAR